MLCLLARYTADLSELIAVKLLFHCAFRSNDSLFVEKTETPKKRSKTAKSNVDTKEDVGTPIALMNAMLDSLLKRSPMHSSGSASGG